MTDIRYKFLEDGMRSARGNHTWEVGVEYAHDGPVELCFSGFHASPTVQAALSYVTGRYIAEVEVSGRSQQTDDKSVHERMKVIRAAEWTPRHSLKLAVFAAELVLPFFENAYPNDDRPRRAIEIARAVAEDVDGSVDDVTVRDAHTDVSAAVSAAVTAAASEGWSYALPPLALRVAAFYAAKVAREAAAIALYMHTTRYSRSGVAYRALEAIGSVPCAIHDAYVTSNGRPDYVAAFQAIRDAKQRMHEYALSIASWSTSGEENGL